VCASTFRPSGLSGIHTFGAPDDDNDSSAIHLCYLLKRFTKAEIPQIMTSYLIRKLDSPAGFKSLNNAVTISNF
jgi:hypothetical protein